MAKEKRSGGGGQEVEPDAEQVADAIWYTRVMFEPEAPPQPGPEPSPKPPKRQPFSSGIGKAPRVPTDPPPELKKPPPPPEFEPDHDVYGETKPRQGFGKTVRGSHVGVSIGEMAGRFDLTFQESVRPLRHLRFADQEVALDVEATAEKIAAFQGKVWAPVFAPKRTPQAVAVVVMEDTPVMRLWEESVEDTVRKLRQSGAFRRVEFWRLSSAVEAVDPHDAEKGGTVALRAYRESGGRVVHPEALGKESHHPVFLLISECLSAGWRSGKIPELLQVWSRRAPAAAMSILPQRLWYRTQLRRMPLRSVRAFSPLRPGSGLEVVDFEAKAPEESCPVGLLGYSADSLAAWSRVLAAAGGNSALAFYAGKETSTFPLAEETELPESDVVFDQFDSSASAPARRLAEVVSACPLIVPVMNLVRRRLVPEAGLEHLTELFLSGLIYRPDSEDPEREPGLICYDFLPGIADRLRDRLRRREAREVLRILSEDVAEFLGGEVIDFMAILNDERGARFELSPHNRPFARVGAAILRRLGERYADVAALLAEDEQGPALSSPPWYALLICDDREPATATALRQLGAVLRQSNVGPYRHVELWTRRATESLEAVVERFCSRRNEGSTLLVVYSLTENAFPVAALEGLGEGVRLFLLGLHADESVNEINTPTQVSGGCLDDAGEKKIDTKLAAETLAVIFSSGGKTTRGNEEVSSRELIDAVAVELEPFAGFAPFATPHDFPVARNPRYLRTKKFDLEFLRCPPGTFQMGSPEKEPGRYGDEGPRHEVTLTREFYLGKYPVTQGQYTAVTGKDNPSRFTDSGENAPVERVSWEEARDFCRRLNGLSEAEGGPRNGWHFALPSEAQWEYACRAGTETGLYSGEEITSESGECPRLDQLAWYDKNSDRKTHPVGGKQANSWGFHDLLGNVNEWCRDFWKDDYEGHGSKDPEGPEKGSNRVLRGGNWFYDARGCRSAYRRHYEPGYRNDNVGFRLVLQTGPAAAAGQWAPDVGQGKAEPDLTRPGTHALLIGWREDDTGVMELIEFLGNGERSGFASATLIGPEEAWRPIWERFCGSEQSEENVLVIAYRGGWGGGDEMTKDDLEALGAGPTRAKVFLGELDAECEEEFQCPEKLKQNTDTLYVVGKGAEGLAEMLLAGIQGGWFGFEGGIDITPSELAESVHRTWSRQWPGGRRNDALGEIFGSEGESCELRLPQDDPDAIICPNPRHLQIELAENDFLEMLHVPAGTFQMGSPEGEVGRDGDEGPRHEVTLTREFYLGKYPVTQRQYTAVTAIDNPSRFKAAEVNAPVEQVSWKDAAAVCQLLNGRGPDEGGPPDGWHFALPSEAQWEYACRGGTESPFAIGDGENIASDLANFDGNHPYGGAEKGKYLERTSEVGSFDPNPWGFYDMHGNVDEWCRDFWKRDYRSEAAEDPEGPETGSYRVMRGGGWFDYARYCRSAFRNHYEPDDRYDYVGFRLVLQTGPPEAAFAPEAGPGGHGKAEPGDRAELDMGRAGRHALLVGLGDENEVMTISKALKADGFIDVVGADRETVVAENVGEILGEQHPENVLLFAWPGKVEWTKPMSAKAGVHLTCQNLSPPGWAHIEGANPNVIRQYLLEGLVQGWAGIRGNETISIGEFAEYSRRRGAETAVPKKAGEIVILEQNPRHRVVEIGEGKPLMELLWVPPGTFTMGDDDAKPVHEVELSRGFWLGKYPVTQAQYAAVTGENPSRFSAVGDQAPVENVSWQMAREFCERLNQKEAMAAGEAFRIPTEAEWEYACRAGTETAFAIGDGENIDSNLANFDGNYPFGKAKKGLYLERTSEVGSYPPNPWGFYDMHGNIWEWCEDWFGDYPSGPQVDPTGPEKGSYRVLRGGFWISGARLCRSACRDHGEPGVRSDYVGFRLVLQTGPSQGEPEAHPDRTAKRSKPGGEG